MRLIEGLRSAPSLGWLLNRLSENLSHNTGVYLDLKLSTNVGLDLDPELKEAVDDHS